MVKKMRIINIDTCMDRNRDMACCPQCDICPYSGFEDEEIQITTNKDIFRKKEEIK